MTALLWSTELAILKNKRHNKCFKWYFNKSAQMRCSIKLDTSGQFLNSIKSWWMWSNGMMKIKQWNNTDPNYSIYTAVQVFLWVVFTKTTTHPSMTKKTRTEFDPNHNCVQYNWVKSQQKYHLWSTVHFDVHFSSINAAPVHQS